MTGIGSHAFDGCRAEIIWGGIPTITKIGGYAFAGYAGTNIAIPDSVTSIGGYAFYDCTSLTSVTIPDSVTGIGEGAFSGCDNLQYNEYGNALYLGNDENPYLVLIKAKKVSITSVDINASTKLIHRSAFYDCTSLTSITIPDSVTSIGDYAFQYCRSLTSVTIENGVTSIGDWAFAYCTSLTSITIPDSVTSIGGYAFSGCVSLTSVNFEGTKEQWYAVVKYSTWKNNCPLLTEVKCSDGSVTV